MAYQGQHPDAWPRSRKRGATSADKSPQGILESANTYLTQHEPALALREIIRALEDPRISIDNPVKVIYDLGESIRYDGLEALNTLPADREHEGVGEEGPRLMRLLGDEIIAFSHMATKKGDLLAGLKAIQRRLEMEIARSAQPRKPQP